MLETIGAFEAKNKLGTLLDRVERGEEIVISRHGRPVARLVPNTPKYDRAGAEAAVERIRARARALPPGSFDWAEIKAAMNEGRP